MRSHTQVIALLLGYRRPCRLYEGDQRQDLLFLGYDSAVPDMSLPFSRSRIWEPLSESPRSPSPYNDEIDSSWAAGLFGFWYWFREAECPKSFFDMDGGKVSRYVGETERQRPRFETPPMPFAGKERTPLAQEQKMEM